MDVKDYSQKLDRARDQFRSAQEDLRSSYDKSVDDLKSPMNLKSTSWEKTTILRKQN